MNQSPEEAATDPQPDLTVGEVALALNCAEETVYREIWRGKFPNAYKVGRDWRVPRSAVEAYKSENSAASGKK